MLVDAYIGIAQSSSPFAFAGDFFLDAFDPKA